MQAEIFDYGMNGEGVAKIDGKIFLIDNALIGETVDIEIVEENSNYSLARAKNVLKPSNNRTNPPCPYFSECGGCDIQHLNYEEQLNFKQNLIKKTIKKICNLEVDVENTVACLTEFGYRNKISLNLNKNKIGFYKRNSKEIININQCLIANENLNKILKIIKKYLKIEENITNFCKNCEFLIKNIVIREINSQILIGFVCKEKIDLNAFWKFISGELKNENLQIGIYLIINTRKDSVVLSGEIFHIAGISAIKNSNFGLNYTLDLLGFHQTNLDIQDKLYNKVLDLIPNDSFVINGFSGQGLLSAILATKANFVVGIEINKNSHNSAENLKKLNKIDNLINIFGDFNKIFPIFENFSKNNNYLNLIMLQKIEKQLKNNSHKILILDPSKKGCGKQILTQIKNINEIIYISCNPIALCKDLNILEERYSISKIIPFDMFPQTKNVETLVHLKLK